MKLALPRTSLFWRTFLLLFLLVALSFSAWSQLFRLFERAPHAAQVAEQIISIVNLTQSALINSNPERRQQLLQDLRQQEGIRVYPLEPEDVRVSLADHPLTTLIQKRVRAALGQQTALEGKVNGIPGLWVSVDIDGDAYWVVMPLERIQRAGALEWFSLGGIALLLALIGAVVFGKWLNRPLADITHAARALAHGESPPALPASGPSEVRLLNQSFNHMVSTLAQIEADRALILAGISHDLRTPITRLRLESEMAPIDESTRSAINGDLSQMEHIVTQFLDYARITQEDKTQQDKRREPIDVKALLEDIVQPYCTTTRQQEEKFTFQMTLRDVPNCLGHSRELRRAVINLIENAIRYGRPEKNPVATIALQLETRRQGQQDCVVIRVVDHGQGIPAAMAETLKRPFTRMDEARGAASGAGLGLAIVQRIAEQHQGRLDLSTTPGGGLTASLIIPASKP
ncbi:MAG: HAMP domain-containing protein [Burkholderiaceae bacterium]|nr:MAG: HAMP domain-containing protein [Burkholderiaceae bacterium]